MAEVRHPACWTRREFVSATALAAFWLMRLPAPARAEGGSPPAGRHALPWHNWSGQQACMPQGRLVPGSEAELAEQLPQVKSPIRPVGAGHSFNALVPTAGTLVSLDRLAGVVSDDPGRLRAEVWGGTRLRQLNRDLAARGQAAENLPDIDAQALAGALATATHGTGDRFGALPTQVTGLALVTASGEVMECDAGHHREVFQAARVSLGSLGLVTRVTLQNRSPYRLRERTWLQDLGEILAEADTLRAQNRHFQIWVPPNSDVALVITANETQDPVTPMAEEDSKLLRSVGRLYEWTHCLPVGGRLLYDTALRLLAGETERVGKSYDIFAHANAVRFNEMEYHLPAEAGPACLREILAAIRKHRPDISFPLEYRYVAEDDLWLSPFHGRESCSIAVHQYRGRDYRSYFALLEPIFWKYAGRPHWGKIHTLASDRLMSLYPRWQDFQGVREALDPEGRFLNAYLRKLLGVAA